MSRSRIPSVAVAVVLTAGALAARQAPQYRTGTNTVPVYATVADRQGRLITDLTRDDFEVLDNGKPQPVTIFANGAQPITVVMMLDRSGSVEEQFRLVESAAAEFVKQLKPADRARIGSFSLDVTIDPATFTGDREVLLTVLRDKLQPLGPTPLWSATLAGMTALTDQPGRRVLLIFTDGHDAPLSDQPKVTFAEVRARAEADEIMVYSIGLVDECTPTPSAVSFNRAGRLPWLQGGGQGGGTQGRGGPGRSGPGRIRLPIPLPLPTPPGRGLPPPKTPTFPEPRAISNSCTPEGPDPSLRFLADIGGGGFFELRRGADLAATFARVAEELHHQYLLGFVAPAHDGLLHRVEVRVKRGGTLVRARRSYRAPQ